MPGKRSSGKKGGGSGKGVPRSPPPPRACSPVSPAAIQGLLARCGTDATAQGAAAGTLPALSTRMVQRFEVSLVAISHLWPAEVDGIDACVAPRVRECRLAASDCRKALESTVECETATAEQLLACAVLLEQSVAECRGMDEHAIGVASRLLSTVSPLVCALCDSTLAFISTPVVPVQWVRVRDAIAADLCVVDDPGLWWHTPGHSEAVIRQNRIEITLCDNCGEVIAGITAADVVVTLIGGDVVRVATAQGDDAAITSIHYTVHADTTVPLKLSLAAFGCPLSTKGWVIKVCVCVCV